MLQEKTCQVADGMALMNEFKICYNKSMTFCGESEEVKEETIKSWKEHLPVTLTVPKIFLTRTKLVNSSAFYRLRHFLTQEKGVLVASSRKRD